MLHCIDVVCQASSSVLCIAGRAFNMLQDSAMEIARQLEDKIIS
ncbi:hypothetical protein [Vibrio sp. 03_296]|nr:hypothetical protein [Vibrio sp. 03_296]